MISPSIQKNDKKAYWLIGIFSIIVFTVVVALSRFQLNIHPSFDVHIFAKIDALTNTIVAILLVAALIAVKQKKYKLHRNIMISAMLLSVVFLISYIAHHLLAGDAKFGDLNHDGILNAQEKLRVGNSRIIYLLFLASHIILAAFVLPFILFTAYRGLTADWARHKKLARYIWPLWLYIAVTGPIVYLLISPYYR